MSVLLIGGTAIAVGGMALTATATAAKVAWDLWEYTPPEIPEAELTPEELGEKKRQEEEEKKRQEEEARRKAEEEKRKEEEAKRLFLEEQKNVWEQMRAEDYRLRSVIEDLTHNIQFTGRKVFVGSRRTGDKFVGVTSEEVPYPADSIEIRPIQGYHERHLLLPSELAYDDDILNARIASGEALVSVHIKQDTVMEEVYEAQYETEIKMLYILLDVSPSMWDENGWRIPLWRGITIRLIERALSSGAPCSIREFDGGIRWRRVILTGSSARQYRHHLWNMPQGSYTNISHAIRVAVKDLQKSQYTDADIMIVTDGEDDNLQHKPIRKLLEESNIKLHAIMLGVQNESLRKCADMYQIVDQDLTLHPLMKGGEV